MTEREPGSTSSIGAVWPPIEASNGRIKGFYDQFVDSESEAESFTEAFKGYEAELASDPNSRLTVRALIATSTLSTLLEHGLRPEGALPLRDDEPLIVYFAANGDGRRTSASALSGHVSMLKEVVAMDRHATGSVEHLASHGLEPRIINRRTDEGQKTELAIRFNELYGAFGYEEDEVVTLLMNPANTIAYVEDETGILSTVMAERASVCIDGYGRIEAVEVTEAITRTSERGRGLYRAISGYLVDCIVECDGHDLDVLYGESNLAMKSVIIAAHHNGRRFSYFDKEIFGVNHPAFGILQQNFRVEDGAETRPYNDFALSYAPLG